jgi:hypothetical protein
MHITTHITTGVLSISEVGLVSNICQRSIYTYIYAYYYTYYYRRAGYLGGGVGEQHLSAKAGALPLILLHVTHITSAVTTARRCSRRSRLIHLVA